MFTVKDAVENERLGAGHAHPLRPGLAPRHAHDAGLLRAARGPDRRPRRPGPAGIHLRQARQGRPVVRPEHRRQGLGQRRPAASLGITDKYWAAAVVPDQTQPFQGSLHGAPGPDRARSIRPTSSARRRRLQPGATDRDDPAPLRRRQGSHRRRRLRGQATASRTSTC